MRPSKGSLLRKQLKNEIRAELISMPDRPSFIIFQGVTYDIPDTDDFQKIMRAVAEQIPRGISALQAVKHGRR
jgi:hypothetical protein